MDLSEVLSGAVARLVGRPASEMVRVLAFEAAEAAANGVKTP